MVCYSSPWFVSYEPLHINKSPIAAMPMNGLRRNDDAMKNRNWYKKLHSSCLGMTRAETTTSTIPPSTIHSPVYYPKTIQSLQARCFHNSL